MRLASPLPSLLDPAGFTVKDAYDAGVSRPRLYRSDLQRPFHGIRAQGADRDDVTAMCRAYSAKMTPCQVFSHVTAAQLHGFPLPPRLSRVHPLHVTTTDGLQPRSAGVRGHRVREAPPWQLVSGLPVTTPAETWLAIASIHPHLVDLVAIVDHMLRNDHAGVGRDELGAMLARHRGRRGVARARCALDRARPFVDSPMETRLRLMIVDHGLPEPVVNMRYFDAAGRYLGKPDLSYPRWRVSIEYEGDHHRTDPWQFNVDIERRERFESDAWSVVSVARRGVSEHPSQTAGVIRRRIALQRRRGVPPAECAESHRLTRGGR